MTDGAVVRQERVAGTLIVVIDAPPVNALGRSVREALSDAIDSAKAHDVTSVVIAAEGRTFPAGADITEFDAPPEGPPLAALCDRIEALGKPVVAALHGTALGGGLELALACHGRVAARAAQLGLPEVTLGILPGAGGTQRLPRLVGGDKALAMMLGGKPVGAEEALASGLVDRVTAEETLLSDALAFARELEGKPLRRTSEATAGLADGRAYMAAVGKARAKVARLPVSAAARIVDCVEAALLLPYAQGAEFERAAFDDLVGTPEAKALRHVFLAERRAMKPPVAGRALRRALVCGAEGAALAEAMLAAGMQVTLAEASEAGLSETLKAIEARGEAAVAAGRMAPEARAADWARLTPALADMGGDAAQDVIVLAGAYAKAGAVLPPVAASVQTGAPVVTLGRVGPGQARAVGLILHQGPLAEVLTSAASAPEAVAAIMVLMKRIGRSPVMAQGRGLVSPCLSAFGASARYLSKRHGAAAVAAVLKGWGLAIADLPEGEAHVVPPAAIAARLMGAVANAGMRLLGEGAAQRPGDIDVALIHAIGWPRHVAGPMLWAASRGLLVVRSDLRGWAEEEPAIWTPAPLFDRMIHDGLRLDALEMA